MFTSLFSVTFAIATRRHTSRARGVTANVKFPQNT